MSYGGKRQHSRSCLVENPSYGIKELRGTRGVAFGVGLTLFPSVRCGGEGGDRHRSTSVRRKWTLTEVGRVDIGV